MTFAAAVVKTPQIRNMLNAKSAAGVAPVSAYTETFMYMCSVAYFVAKDLADNGQIDSFQEYGENVFLILQNVVIVALMWRYTKPSAGHVLACLAAFGGFWAWALSLPNECGPVVACTVERNAASCLAVRPCQSLLIALPLPLMLMARLPQVSVHGPRGPGAGL